MFSPRDLLLLEFLVLKELFQFSPRIWEKIENKFTQFSTYKAATHNSRAIVSVMKSFEKFMFSFGLAKFANSSNPRRTFNVLESSDTDVVIYKFLHAHLEIIERSWQNVPSCGAVPFAGRGHIQQQVHRFGM